MFVSVILRSFVELNYDFVGFRYVFGAIEWFQHNFVSNSFLLASLNLKRYFKIPIIFLHVNYCTLAFFRIVYLRWQGVNSDSAPFIRHTCNSENFNNCFYSRAHVSLLSNFYILYFINEEKNLFIPNTNMIPVKICLPPSIFYLKLFCYIELYMI